MTLNQTRRQYPASNSSRTFHRLHEASVVDGSYDAVEDLLTELLLARKESSNPDLGDFYPASDFVLELLLLEALNVSDVELFDVELAKARVHKGFSHAIVDLDALAEVTGEELALSDAAEVIDGVEGNQINLVDAASGTLSASENRENQAPNEWPEESPRANGSHSETLFARAPSPSPSPTTILHQRRLSLFSHFDALLQNSCRNARHLLQMQALLVTSSLFRNPFLARTVLSRASHLCNFAYTLLIFRTINSLGTFCVNTVIKSYCNSHAPREAIVFYFRSLMCGFFPNSYTFVPLVASCAKMGCIDSGKECHAQATKNGVDSVLPVQNSLIHMYACYGDVQLARVLFDGMLSRDLVSRNSIIDGIMMVGELNAAHRLLNEMPDRNLVTWNVMISGYLKGRNPGYAMKLFREMGRLGLRGDARTMVCVATACGRKVEDARRVFERMGERNLVSWNAMILGHCIRGSPEDGLGLFDVMIGMGKMKYGVESDETPRLLPDEVPSLVFSVRVLGRRCWLRGEEFLRSIAEFDGDMSRESLAWASLLGLCHFKRDAYLGERIAKILIEMDPKNRACYQFLLIIYAVSAQWQNVSGVQKLIKERRLGIIARSSLVDLKNIVHNFKVTDKGQEGIEAHCLCKTHFLSHHGLFYFPATEGLVVEMINLLIIEMDYSKDARK
ncbi:Pentatricopeptide repeat-containing protein [Glycine soja]|nr:Pentatricopeptide repeat-containing protein [Glycine soja]